MSRSLLSRCITTACLAATLLASILTLSAQTEREVNDAEQQLKALFDSIISAGGDEQRIRAGIKFSIGLLEALTLQGSFEYPFSLLPTLSTLTSPDKKFRIYTWNIPLYSGIHRFYGIIQLKLSADNNYMLINLEDHAEKNPSPEQEILTPEKWLGAVYYDLIPCHTVHGEVFYTLLGWRGETFLLNSKLIEILTISPSGEVHFGKNVFCNDSKDHPMRIIFSHSANVTISLRYEKQTVVTGKQWNTRRKEFIYRREKNWMIVCDRLVPSHPQLEGQYEYYIPAGDVMDGFLFREGCWNLISDIDARNPG